MKFFFLKIWLLLASVFLTTNAFSQDTIKCDRVLVCNVVINKKTGTVYKKFWRKLRVKNGYIVKRNDGFFDINGKLMKPDDFSYEIVKVK